MAGRLAPHSGPVRASCASRLTYRLPITFRSLLQGGLSIPLRMSTGIFVQCAATPARGRHRQAHQVLVLLSDSKVKAVAFHPAEEFPASPTSPLAIQHFPPFHSVRGGQMPHRWGTFSRGENENDMTGY